MQQEDSPLRSNYALLMFYVRERYWRHAEDVCTSMINTSDDRLFRVWRGLCYLQQGLVNEAMREFKGSEQHRQTAIPALMGMQIIYKRNKDHEGLTRTELQLSGDAFEGKIDGWVQAAAMCWAVNDINGAKDLLIKYQESHADHDDEYTNLATLRGWIDLSSGRSALIEKCGSLFQRVLDQRHELDGRLDLNAAMGRVAYLERKYQFLPAQELLSRLIVANPNFTPALVVKARLLMRAEDWEQAVETTQRILSKDKTNIEAIALEVLYALVKDSRFAAAAVHLNTLLTVVTEKEPRNAALCYQFARAFACLSGGNLQLLGLTAKFAEAALQLASRNGEYMCEVGYQQLFRGDYKGALTKLKEASTLTDSLTPLLGCVHCQVKLGKLEEASKQLDFCNELQPTTERNAELSWLNAVVLWQLNKDDKRSIVCLDQAAEAIRQDVAAQPGNGMELYVKLNQPLMLAIAREYLLHCRNEPPDPSFRRPDLIADRCRKHLELLTRHVPGCMEAQLMLARIHFVSGDLNQAQSIVKQCLRQENLIPEVYLLSAQVCQYVGNVKLAGHALEQALTLDFEIKDQPYYNLLLGIVHGMMNEAQPSLDALQHAMDIIKSGDRLTSKGALIQPLSIPEQVTLYLQLAQAHVRLHDVDSARKLLTEAANSYRNNPQSGRIAIAHAMLFARTDVDKAIETLRQVPQKNEFFVPARTQMAKLYLVQRQNPIKYAQCFEEMVQEEPSVQSYVELGEAYEVIQEPEKAIVAYEQAKSLDPGNRELAVRIGRSMVSIHNYKGALEYYSDALGTDANLFNVRADLAMLQWHLGSPADAVQTLRDSPEFKAEPDAQDDVMASVNRVNCMLILYKILNGSGKRKEAGDALRQARECQLLVLQSKLRSESRETMLQQKTVMATIATELGRFYTTEWQQLVADGAEGTDGPLSAAKEHFLEALKFDEAMEEAMLELAHLYERSDNFEACEQQCQSLLRMNDKCEEATVLMASLMLRREQLDEAAALFKALLEKKADNYVALVQYIELLRRAGHLESVEELLEKAAAEVPPGQRPDPGLSYARGLYYHYFNANPDALRHFNLARIPSGNPWCEKAITQMIGIYLVPSTEDLWMDNWSVDEKNDNIKCAEALLSHLPRNGNRTRMQAFCLLATKRPQSVERAMHIFLESIQRHQPGAANTTPRQKTAPGKGATPPKGNAPQIVEGEESGEDNIAEDAEAQSHLLSPNKLKGKLDSEDEADEDDLLLQDASRMGGAAAGSATLAAAMECDKVHIPSFLGLSISLVLAGQETAARNALRRLFSGVAQCKADRSLLDDLQRARLLDAHLDIRAGHLETAQETLKSVIEDDKSCSTAWDALGMLYEKKHEHQEASSCYQKAWKQVKGADPAVGYKLAFNYLKGNELVKAIDVCKKVLAAHPSYPRITEDIMDIAYSMLRP